MMGGGQISPEFPLQNSLGIQFFEPWGNVRVVNLRWNALGRPCSGADLLLPGSLPAACNGLCHVASAPGWLLWRLLAWPCSPLLPWQLVSREFCPCTLLLWLAFTTPLACESLCRSHIVTVQTLGCAAPVSVLVVWGRGGTPL